MSTTIMILGGKDKSGKLEKVSSLEITSGEIYSIVGFTGSGKSQLISDIEQMAQGDTLTGRSILVNGAKPEYSIRYNPNKKMVAQLSQNMNFALEMEVSNFIKLHGESRGICISDDFVKEIIECANTLAGEKIYPSDILTRLSGGQSRALMIADIAHISQSPIILIDEVENAGIDRKKAMDLLSNQGKIILIVTHDAQLALMGEKRIVMKNGGMERIIQRNDDEIEAGVLLKNINEVLLETQNHIRSGESINRDFFSPIFSNETIFLQENFL